MSNRFSEVIDMITSGIKQFVIYGIIVSLVIGLCTGVVLVIVIRLIESIFQ